MRKITLEEFIKKAKIKHKYPDNYGYDKVIYNGYKQKIEIYCPRCKKYFWQTAANHLKGEGCMDCGRNKTIEKQKLSHQEILKKFKKSHPTGYIYIGQYNGYDKKMKIMCQTCGNIFFQTPANHINGKGCPNCKFKKLSQLYTKTREQFINDVEKVHGKNKYNYDEFIYKNHKTKSIIYCNNCKRKFFQSPSKHLQGQGCPFCSKSHGEEFICRWLISNNINFEQEKRFNDCKDLLPLPFDFYLPDYNTCIEYQGRQHYTPKMQIMKHKSIKNGIMAFKKQLRHDKIKRKYCKNHGIRLVEIKYTKNIEKILINTFKKRG